MQNTFSKDEEITNFEEPTLSAGLNPNPPLGPASVGEKTPSQLLNTENLTSSKLSTDKNFEAHPSAGLYPKPPLGPASEKLTSTNISLKRF